VAAIRIDWDLLSTYYCPDLEVYTGKLPTEQDCQEVYKTVHEEMEAWGYQVVGIADNYRYIMVVEVQ